MCMIKHIKNAILITAAMQLFIPLQSDMSCNIGHKQCILIYFYQSNFDLIHSLSMPQSVSKTSGQYT